MPFSSANTRFYAFLIELHLECMDAEYLIKRLRHGARHWRLQARGRDFDRKVTPRDIQVWAHALLGTLNRIRQYLQPGSRDATVRLRCRVLNKIIGPVQIDQICSPAVRHSWEHLDERLDGLFAKKTFTSYSHFSLGYRPTRPERPDHLDFRKFDVYALTLTFGDESISLKDCLKEVRELGKAVVTAHDSMADGRIVPWQ